MNSGYLDYTFIATLSALFAAIANVLARILLKGLKAKNIVGINFLTMAATLVVLSPLYNPLYLFHAQ